MRLSELGGEFAFIRRISRAPKLPGSVLGIGDDAALIRPGAGLLAVTADMVVEGDHFSMDYFTPRQLGIKSMESNVSDIAAMGARPLYAFISICLPKTASVEFIDGFYSGIYSSCKKHGIDVLGGDTTHGALIVVNVALIGEVAPRKKPMLRSGAKNGDLIFVTGHLGASTAGLKLLRAKVPGFSRVKKRHLEPASRMDVSGEISKIANACEDVSDGLASEVRNICLASKKGAVIYAGSIPLAAQTIGAAKAVGENALDYALFGGEDFELVFTVPAKFILKAQRLGTLVGKISGGRGVFLERNGKRELLTKFGYDHFA